MQLLLSDTDYCSGQQVALGEGTTSLTSSDRVQSVPLLPIPFVNASLTRVIFQTGIGLQQLREILSINGVEGEEEEEEEEEEGEVVERVEGRREKGRKGREEG